MDQAHRRSGSHSSERPTTYEIRIEGHLDDRWADGHEGLIATLEESGETVLTVPVVDQAALHGLLRMLRDLGVRLISINPTGPGRPDHDSREATG